MVSLLQVQLVIFRVSPGLAMCPQEKMKALRHHTSLCRVRSQSQLSLEVTSGADNWSRPLTMVRMISNEDALGLNPCGFLTSLNCLDHFLVDPAPVRATGHQLVTLCCSICAEERAQILDPLMGSKYLTM